MRYLENPMREKISGVSKKIPGEKRILNYSEKGVSVHFGWQKFASFPSKKGQSIKSRDKIESI
jgi:hypothetical protein